MPPLAMRPAEIAAEILGVPLSAVGGVERIKHGLTNESWLVRAGGDALVVRLSTIDEGALQIDRGSEASVLAAVSAAGIGPQVLLCDPGRRVLVTRFLAGNTWSQAEAQQPANIERLGALLRRLHALPIPAGARRLDLLASVQGYWHTLDVCGAGSSVDAPTVRRHAREVIGELARRSVPCLCHNDLNPLNIIDNGRLQLVDWEYAAVGEPLFDLASICSSHGYGPSLRQSLRTAYAPPASVDPQRLELACWLFDYVRDLWMAVRESAP